MTKIYGRLFAFIVIAAFAVFIYSFLAWDVYPMIGSAIVTGLGAAGSHLTGV